MGTLHRVADTLSAIKAEGKSKENQVWQSVKTCIRKKHLRWAMEYHIENLTCVNGKGSQGISCQIH